MIALHSVTPEDKKWIDPLVWAEGSSNADFAFGSIYLWDLSFRQLVGRIDDRVIVLPCYDKEPFFAWPVGLGDPAPVMEEMKSFARSEGFPFVLRGVTKEHLPLLDELYPGHYTAEPERPLWDYLYSAEKLAALSGKKLHGKRNHVNRFEAEHEWSFRPLSRADFPACIDLLNRWDAEHPEDAAHGANDEAVAICRAFDRYESLGLDGGVLRVGDEPVAFTVGERICEHTFVVHFEKARTDLNGAYPMVNREFVRLIQDKYPSVRWINREDDMGIESLRRSKESYHPDGMVEKFRVTIQ